MIYYYYSKGEINMKCTECGYHWKEEDEAFARCHFVGPDGWAPCEQEEESEDE